jgi:hypothetical protein
MDARTGSVPEQAGINFRLALAFPFEDKNWFGKILIPALVQCIPLFGLLAATGWALEICRRMVRKEARELPVLKFRRDLAGGLRVWGVTFLFGMPVWLWLGAGGLLSVPLWHANNRTATGSFDALWWGVECGALLIALAAAMGAQAAVGRLAETGSFRAAFQLREVVSILRSAPVVYLQVVLAWFPLGLLALSGIAVCGVGAFFTTAYALAAGFHLSGQAQALTASRRLPPAAPPAA